MPTPLEGATVAPKRFGDGRIVQLGIRDIIIELDPIQIVIIPARIQVAGIEITILETITFGEITQDHLILGQVIQDLPLDPLQVL